MAGRVLIGGIENWPVKKRFSHGGYHSIQWPGGVRSASRIFT
jgi:hypothetical protein